MPTSNRQCFQLVLIVAEQCSSLNGHWRQAGKRAHKPVFQNFLNFKYIYRRGQKQLCTNTTSGQTGSLLQCSLLYKSSQKYVLYVSIFPPHNFRAPFSLDAAEYLWNPDIEGIYDSHNVLIVPKQTVTK